ncbi:EAL domain-containing protein [Noviherbaspirillum sedimenti]|uniref:EAL domain-containing protein n=1 Tax=Noviherbaspirillum sedimenti TaxID=2320865 RepID=A0A3A3G562_9BURK|nr:EAL domain-containing protein [Noviherbaspirillum sedimenti]RJG01919.1 EAL domain-containing protein [Noviherbaspirillum sedimenti]
MNPSSRTISEPLRLALNSGGHVAFDWDIGANTLQVSSELPACFSHVPLQGISQVSALHALIHEEDLPTVKEQWTELLHDSLPHPELGVQVDLRLQDSKIGWRWVSLSGQVAERDADGLALRAVGVLTDIMARKAHEERIGRLRDLYAALRQTNQAILHARDRQALFNQICRIAVERGGFQMAMVRLIDPASQELVPVAGHGTKLPPTPIARISIDADKAEGKGPAGISIREARPSICNDFLGMGFHEEWIELANCVGFRSVGSFPFRQAGKVIGALLLYAEDRDYFDQELIELLEEMTNEISFALDNFEQQAKRTEVEAALANSENLKNAILQAALDCIISCDERGFIIDFNPAAERTFGHAREDIIGQPLAERLLTPDSGAQFQQGMTDLLQNSDSPLHKRRIELWAMHAEGMRFPVEVAVAPIALGDRLVFTAYMRDISEWKQSQAILADSEARYRQLIDLSPEAIFVHQHGKFVLLNQACLQLFGVRQSGELLGQPVSPFVHPDYKDISKKRALALPMGELQTGQVEEVWLKIDGTAFHAEVSGSKFIYLGAPAVQIVMRDISARKLAEALQHAQNAILGMIAGDEALPDILATLTRLIEDQSERGKCAIALLNAERSHLHAVVAPSLPRGFVDAMTGLAVGPCHASAGTAAFRREPVLATDIASDPLWIMWRELALPHGLQTCSAWPIFGKNNKVLGALSLYHRERHQPSENELQVIEIAANLTGIAIENKETEDRIRYLAHYDEMTALPNRALFNQILNHAMKSAHRRQKKLAVMFVDLDRFKNINDTFGHSAGDQALQEFAERMRGCLRENDTVARMGGDEFYVLIEELIDGQIAAGVAEKILEEAARPFYVDGQECHLSASIGIALYPDDGGDAMALLKNSDIAMYRAKSDGKNAFRFYSASKNTHSVERLALESQLRRAIDNQELALYYQPKVDVYTGRINGVEALVRWQHPDLGLLPPQHFIPLAEETRLIIPLSKHILRIACEDTHAINRASGYPVRVAVNLSARQLDDSHFPDTVQQLLEQTALDPDLLQLEITESMVMDNPEQAVEIMNRLRAMGIRLDIDDFGTGYSSLAYLKRFPVYSLKIDRSFIQDIPNGPNDTAITQAIIAMAHSMGMRVVAEGVEKKEQAEALRQFGCDEYQGFYFSHPVPLSKLLDLLGNQKVWMQAMPASLKAS